MGNELKTNRYIELHLHLDGAITVDIAKKLAEIQQIKLPADDDKELLGLLSVPSDCESLNDFLKCFDLPLTLLQTKEGISEAVYLVAENMKMQGVVYAEIRFAPQLHIVKGLSQEDAVKAALDGIKRCDMPVNLILCCMRGNDNYNKNMETVLLASKYLVKNGGIVAVDLAGAEALFPNEQFDEIFEKVREYKIPFTMHAGEAAGAESVKKAIQMGASRIGHGVRICEDEAVMELVRDKGICLEMCPTSNRQTKAVLDMKKYPLKKYMEAGIKVTVNTDDAAICRTTISEEFEYVNKLCNLTESMITQLWNNAVDAAFTDEYTKNMLRKEVSYENRI